MRGRRPAHVAVVIGQPELTCPSGAQALEVIDLLSEILYLDLTQPPRVSTEALLPAGQPHENTAA